jgi:hypothetical protein
MAPPDDTPFRYRGPINLRFDGLSDSDDVGGLARLARSSVQYGLDQLARTGCGVAHRTQILPDGRTMFVNVYNNMGVPLAVASLSPLPSTPEYPVEPIQLYEPEVPELKGSPLFLYSMRYDDKQRNVRGAIQGKHPSWEKTDIPETSEYRCADPEVIKCTSDTIIDWKGETAEQLLCWYVYYAGGSAGFYGDRYFSYPAGYAIYGFGGAIVYDDPDGNRIAGACYSKGSLIIVVNNNDGFAVYENGPDSKIGSWAWPHYNLSLFQCPLFNKAGDTAVFMYNDEDTATVNIMQIKLSGEAGKQTATFSLLAAYDEQFTEIETETRGDFIWPEYWKNEAGEWPPTIVGQSNPWPDNVTAEYNWPFLNSVAPTYHEASYSYVSEWQETTPKIPIGVDWGPDDTLRYIWVQSLECQGYEWHMDFHGTWNAGGPLAETRADTYYSSRTSGYYNLQIELTIETSADDIVLRRVYGDSNYPEEYVGTWDLVVTIAGADYWKDTPGNGPQEIERRTFESDAFPYDTLLTGKPRVFTDVPGLRTEQRIAGETYFQEIWNGSTFIDLSADFIGTTQMYRSASYSDYNFVYPKEYGLVEPVTWTQRNAYNHYLGFAKIWKNGSPLLDEQIYDNDEGISVFETVQKQYSFFKLNDDYYSRLTSDRDEPDGRAKPGTKTDGPWSWPGGVYEFTTVFMASLKRHGLSYTADDYWHLYWLPESRRFHSVWGEGGMSPDSYNLLGRGADFVDAKNVTGLDYEQYIREFALLKARNE